MCVFADKATTGTTALTQTPSPQDPWLTNALEAQHHLGDTLPFRDAMWVGTHNSFNTAANTPPSLSNTDSNQHLSLAQQLALGIRGIEIDVHWLPSVWAGGANAPVVCHGRPPSELNIGCTDERLLDAELAPVAQWVADNPDDVVLIYVEDNIGAPAGYDAAADAVARTLGDHVYRPPAAQPCQVLPLTLHRADVLAAHKQVVIMSGCGSSAWNATVFDDSIRSEEGNPDFAGFPACTSPSVQRADYGTKLVRFYEDSTFVSTAVAGGDPGHRLTTDTINAMVRCGVNLFGLDQVDPNDSRLAAMVWSWAPNEPSATGACAVDGSDNRFHAVPCSGAPLPFACVDTNGRWYISTVTRPRWDARRPCKDGTFAVPRSGAQAEQLREAKAAAGVDTVWLAYRSVDGTWSGPQ